jgi:hypothetical protein
MIPSVLRYTQALADYPIVATWVIAEKCKGIPDNFKGSTLLNIGLNMRVPISDLRVNETGISGTLSFNRRPHFVVLPWDAIQQFMSEEERLLRCAAQDSGGLAPSAASRPNPMLGDKRVLGREDNVVRVRFGK